MRTKLLQGRDDVTVQLVYPSTLDEYRQALDALGGSLPAAGNGDSPPAGCKPGHAVYVVTTGQQRHLWALPVSGGVVPVDEPRALDLLHDAAAEPGRAAGLFPGRSPEVVSGLDAGAPGGSWFDAVRGFLSPGARIDQAVGALDRAGLPSAVHEALSDRLNEVFGSGAKVAEAELDRVRVVLDLPWAKSESQRFDRAHVAQVLGRTHVALDGVKAGMTIVRISALQIILPSWDPGPPPAARPLEQPACPRDVTGMQRYLGATSTTPATAQAAHTHRQVSTSSGEPRRSRCGAGRRGSCPLVPPFGRTGKCPWADRPRRHIRHRSRGTAKRRGSCPLVPPCG